MKSQIKKKLTSNKGASITYALLLFLVCTVVTSVVLTAGTASSGRMSQIAQMEQGYYSVTSAAKLLSGDFSGKTITVTKRIETGSDDKYYVADTSVGSTETYPGDAPGDVVSILESTIKLPTDNRTLLKDIAVHRFAGIEFSDTTYSFEGTDPGVSNSPIEDSNVDVTASVLDNGTMVLTIFKNYGTNRRYQLFLTFSIATSKRKEINEDKGYTDEITDYTWTLDGIQTPTTI